MAPSITLFCLAIDHNQNRSIYHPLVIPFSHHSFIGELQHEINHRLRDAGIVDKYTLNLWKILAKLPIGDTSTEKASLETQIMAIEFPIPKSDLAITGGNGVVQWLDPFKPLSDYWTKTPNPDHLHVIVQITQPISPSSSADSKLSYGTASLNDMDPPPAKRPRIESSPQIKLLRDVECFWKLTWGNDTAAVPFCTCIEVQRDNSLSADISPANGVPTTCWTMQPPKEIRWLKRRRLSAFLIRDDYIVAFRHLFKAAGLDDTNIFEDWPKSFKNPFFNTLGAVNDPEHQGEYGGFILTGYPGIGKSLLLWILLVLRLHARLPTFYQHLPHEVFYFTDQGVQKIKLEDVVMIERAPHAWALIDSDTEVISVNKVYYDGGIFIVQTPSPRETRIEWSKKASLPIARFILKPWSLSELICGRQLHQQKMSENNIALFFWMFGPSARNAFKYASNSEDFHHELASACENISLDRLHTFFEQAAALDFTHKLSHLVLVIPKSDSNRSQHIVTFPSQYILDLLVLARNTKTADAAKTLCNSLMSAESTKGASGNIFDMLIHAIFTDGGYLPISRLSKSPKPGPTDWHWKTPEPKHASNLFLHIHSLGFATESQRPTSHAEEGPLTYRLFIRNKTTDLQTGYYRSAIKNQTTFDAFIYDAKTQHALIIQATVAPSHDLNVGGIEELEKLGVTQFSYLVVTPPDTPLDLPFPLKIEQKFQNVYQYLNGFQKNIPAVVE